jgi:hypothetical protein
MESKIIERFYSRGKLVKSRVKKEIQRILHDQSYYQEILGDDRSLVLDLFKLHPSISESVLSTVSTLIVVPSILGSRCFSIKTTHGFETTVSYLACLESSNPKRFVAIAARGAIADQISEFKWKCDRKCAISGEVLVDGDIDIDHVHPTTFDKLLCDFVHSNGVSFDSIKIHHAAFGVKFEEESFSKDWKEYHRKNANLRALSRKVHQNLRIDA